MLDNIASQAYTMLNVRVVVAKKDELGKIQVVSEKRFKNTATRLLTESICNYLTGSENSYKRGKGRPNYMGIGTMGITKQNNLEPADVVDNFSDTTYEPGETTRPWFESTSLGLTTVCGAVNLDDEGNNTHFWDPLLGWGKDGFTGEPATEPIFQGELCTARQPGGEVTGEDVERIPILRAEVISDCPADWDYGTDGYSSQAIFYGYASVEWVHKLLKPEHGPQLDRMAISEFGLYEKTNTDPHGLETMLAGFRVPTPEDIVYVTDGEVILIEWRISIRALMPYEGVHVATEPSPTGIAVLASVQDEKNVQLTALVRGPIGVRQGVVWSITGQEDDGTTISDTGLLHLAEHEPTDVVYVTAASIVDPFISAQTAVITGLLKNVITGISITTESISALEIQLLATVLGKGTFIHDVTWELSGNDNPSTTIDENGLLQIDFDETSNEFQITATSVGDPNVYSIAAVIRIDKVSGSYVISDFTILTES